MVFSNVDLLSSEYVNYVEDGKVRVVESRAGGEGVCNFDAQSPALMIKASDKAPVVWALKNRKCAEGAFLVKRQDQSLELHIVEMKSKLSHSEFCKVLEQWRGMFLSALAALGIMRTDMPSKVVVYIAYKREDVLSGDGSNLILNKTLVGGGLLPGRHEWTTEKVELDHGIVASIVKGRRDQNSGDCDFGVI